MTSVTCDTLLIAPPRFTSLKMEPRVLTVLKFKEHPTIILSLQIYMSDIGWMNMSGKPVLAAVSLGSKLASQSSQL